VIMLAQALEEEMNKPIENYVHTLKMKFFF
jgi:hypothetical protein